jgi:hypothetical protein
MKATVENIMAIVHLNPLVRSKALQILRCLPFGEWQIAYNIDDSKSIQFELHDDIYDIEILIEIP